MILLSNGNKPSIRKQIENSRKLPAKLKPEILKYVTSSTRYENGKVVALQPPSSMLKISPKIKGCSLGADKDGFFVHTHRASSKRYSSPNKIPKKWIDYIESTG